MKISRLTVLLLIMALIVAVSASAQGQSLPLTQDTEKASKFFALLEENGVIVTSKEATNSETETVTDAGEKQFSCDYTPTPGINYSFTYTDGYISSYMLTVDMAESYANSKMTIAMMCHLMAHMDYSSSDAISIMDYLIGTTKSDPVFGAVSELERDGYTIKFNITPVDSMFFIIYPPEPVDAA